MSRIAAAYFNEAAPDDWRGMCAGVEPGEMLSHTPARLFAGTSATALLDLSPPRPIGAVPNPERTIALRNPAIHYELEGAETWDLAHSDGELLRHEIRARVEALVHRLTSEAGVFS